jgi:hypothetical protein
MDKIAGQDESQRLEDAKGYKTTVDMLTGGGTKEVDSETGPEVCAPYGENMISKGK